MCPRNVSLSPSPSSLLFQNLTSVCHCAILWVPMRGFRTPSDWSGRSSRTGGRGQPFSGSRAAWCRFHYALFACMRRPKSLSFRTFVALAGPRFAPLQVLPSSVESCILFLSVGAVLVRKLRVLRTQRNLSLPPKCALVLNNVDSR